MMNNQILLHILKQSPKDGDIYFTFEGETFHGKLQSIAVETSANSLTTFTITGIVINE